MPCALGALGYRVGSTARIRRVSSGFGALDAGQHSTEVVDDCVSAATLSSTSTSFPRFALRRQGRQHPIPIAGGDCVRVPPPNRASGTGARVRVRVRAPAGRLRAVWVVRVRAVDSSALWPVRVAVEARGCRSNRSWRVLPQQGEPARVTLLNRWVPFRCLPPFSGPLQKGSNNAQGPLIRR